ncbi:hypothetical protein [Flavobacterium litorale]|uniref:Uncharacterized protein n=1 Tax=Flavobacterium litorale TaxID=2856519 RepID=A0ABX8VEC0_9FLAO|nr:hypothetical protein [Flavobacterium litorale]QYJ68994.1 hypothetical protein K1I41_03660 [Flavobacterium litorale]
MKKLLPLLFVTLFFAVGCSSSKLKKDSERIAFEYEAVTMMGYNKVIVKQDTVITFTSRAVKDAVTTGLKNGEWNKMLTALEKVELDKVSKLKAPSAGYASDAAPAANLTIIKNNTTYRSAVFDHGNPPAEIKELVTKIVNASALKNKR